MLGIMLISIALIYMLSKKITSPLLWLQKNVKKISVILEKMVKGSIRPSASLLTYDPDIKTKDEIKALSDEIGNMIEVIQSMIPYISASTLKSVKKKGISSEKKEIAFLFTDIRGFTNISEKLKPEEVVKLLNRYLNLQTEVIHKHKGEVDKFVGDEMMAYFIGKNKIQNILDAALEIKKEMEKENLKRKSNNLQTVDIGIGMNVGNVIFGSMGAQDRMDYTSIGDTVNLASRLESTNKVYRTKIVISEYIKKKMPAGYIIREIDSIIVKGKEKPVSIYELICSKKGSNRKIAKFKQDFEKALGLYRKMKWVKAEKEFGRVIDTYGDETSKVFISRIKTLKSRNLGGWSGIWVMDSK